MLKQVKLFENGQAIAKKRRNYAKNAKVSNLKAQRVLNVALKNFQDERTAG